MWIHCTHADQSKVDLLEEPKGVTLAPSMMSLHSHLEDRPGIGLDVNLCCSYDLIRVLCVYV